MIIHPAYSIPFEELISGLKEEIEKGNVNTRHNGVLTQWTYSQECQYNSNWNLYTKCARGLITDLTKIVGLPFPKFFNLQENKTDIPDLPFHAYEKVDGSLIIAYYYDGWQTATKGSFQSDQAIWAKEFMKNNDYWKWMVPRYTYLFEYIGPTNKIVINYPEEDMILLGAYDNLIGEEMSSEWINKYTYCNVAETYSFPELEDVIMVAEQLSHNEEGYVLKYQDGTRVKIKGAEYCRIHKLISNITPLAIWEMMWQNDNLEFIRKELPEEFLIDFDIIVDIFKTKVYNILNVVKETYEKTKDWTDKEIGLQMESMTPEVKKLIFPYRKNNGNLLEDKRCREAMFRMFRPTGNILPGYIQSNSMNRIMQDDG